MSSQQLDGLRRALQLTCADRDAYAARLNTPGPAIPFDLWSGAMGQQKARPCKLFHTWRRVWGGADNGASFMKCGRCGAEWFPPTALTGEQPR